MDDLNMDTGGTAAESHEAAAVVVEEPKPWLEAYADVEGFHREALEKFKDPGELGKSYLELQKKMGTAVNIPADGDEEGWRAFNAKMGCPDAPEKYELPITEGVPQDEDFRGKMAQVMFENGMSQKMAAALTTANDAYAKEKTAQATEANEKLNNARAEAIGWNDTQKTEATEHFRRKVVEFSEKYTMPEGDQSLAQMLLDENGKFTANDPLMVAFANFCMDNPKEDKGLVRGDQTGSGDDGYVPDHGPDTYRWGDHPDTVKAQVYYSRPENGGHTF